MNVLVFDIETVPDLAAGRRLYGLEGLEEAEVARAMHALRRQETEGRSDFLRHPLHQVVVIGMVMRREERLHVWSLGVDESSEEELLRRFFDGIERFSPTLVSWNGGGFDLPVLHYRALLHGVAAPRYWETGEEDPSFRYNNYLGRFHWRHIDLMDVLSAYQGRAQATLAEVACLLGLPGKLGMDGAQVWERYLAGQLRPIREYCEADALNTYLIYLRFELMRGRLARAGYEAECGRLRAYLEAEGRPHFKAFLEAWRP